MGYGDLGRYRKIGSNTIINGNIEENVNHVNLTRNHDFCEIFRENSEWVTNKKMFIANALWEMI